MSKRVRKISRRDFLSGSAMAAVGLMLSACGPKPAPTAEPAPQATAAAPEATSAPVTEATTAPATEATAAPPAATTAKEAPMLADLVQAGSLPPVTDRLPSNPLVIDVPWGEVGQYGGTLQMVHSNPTFDDLQVYMYGHSPLQWQNGGTATGPGLAESWESNDDATEWTFYFRQGIKWSDGEPFTVDDILFWWEDMALNTDCSEAIPSWALVGGKPMEVTKIDDYTVKFTFAATAPLTDFELATGSFFAFTYCPIPRHYMEQFHPKYNSDNADYTTFDEKKLWWQNPDMPVLSAWKPTLFEAGQRTVWDRNPYYWCVDKDGQQLPYIDKLDVGYAEDLEVVKLQIINGNIDFHVYPQLPLSALPVMKDNTEAGSYHVEFWDNGAGGAPAWTVNRNQADPEKAEVVAKPEFERALSFAINRPRIRTMLFFGLGGPDSTGTVSPNTAEFNRTEEGKAIFQEWRDHAAAYDPEKAKQLLDEAGAVDQNGDGWRELPSGKPLKLIIYNNVPTFAEAADMLKEDWQAVGLDVVVTEVSGQQIGTDWHAGSGDVRIWGGGAPDAPDILSYPAWLVSYGADGRWAPLYGQWMALQGTPQEGVDADKDPRDRQPPWEEPPADDPTRRMYEIYKQAIREPDMAKRDKLVFDIVRIHIDEGPFLIGMIADLPYIIIVKNGLRNVPTHDEIPMGGWVGPWVIAEPGAVTYPEQYWFES